MNNKPNIVFRDAVAADADAIAGFLVSAWPVDAFLSMSDDLTEEGLVQIVAGYVRAENTVYSYRFTIVACREDNGEVVGAINGYDGADADELKKPVLEDLRRRFGEVEYSRVKETGAGEFYLDSIGVNAELRSCGIGSGLFKAMLARAAADGHSVAGLLVDFDNPRAEALYARLGFKYVGETDFLGHPMKHLQINL